MNIIDFIPYGKENAVTRWQLMDRLNLPDRQIRRMIQSARNRGEIIINAQDGSGYYRSLDIGELKRQYKTNRSRALSILQQQKHLARMIVQLEDVGQMTIEEVSNG